MKRCILLLLCLGVALGNLTAEITTDQQRKDRLLSLHRSILVGKKPVQVQVLSVPNIGAMLGDPQSTVTGEGGGPMISADTTSPSATAAPELPKTVGPYPSLLDNNMIVAFYGSPFSTRMGILGEQGIEETARLVKLQAGEWATANGEKQCIPAFHLIYATVWTDANVGILSDKVVQQYIDFAAANDMIVILDHQLGKNSVVSCVGKMLRWLKFPNVHLAIDPEWKTVNPGREIGSIDASDVNTAQEMIQEYLVKENIQQKKLFIVHQFNWKMITNREKVRSDFDRIDLIHNADGFGNPDLKLGTYNFVALAKNMPIKGFKLFFPKSWKSDGFDKPMMTPQQVLNLNPRPVYINYQ